MRLALRSAFFAMACVTSMSVMAQTPPAKPVAAKPAVAPAASGMTEKQKNSYMIGMDVAKSLGQIKDEVDINVLTQAMQTVFAGKPTLLTEAQSEQIRAAFGQKMQAKMAGVQAQQGQKNLAEGQKFLAANKTKPGVRATASGLQYLVMRPGSGARPAATDTVRVHYKGTLLDGKTFDSSYDRGQPVEFPLNRVIPGWTEGVGLMPVGSKYKLWIPANLGYGTEGSREIGPNAMLTFEVELIAIVKP